MNWWSGPIQAGSADVGLVLTPSLGMDFMLVFNFTNIIKGSIKSKSMEQSGQAEVFLLALLLSVFQSSVRMSAWVCVEVEGGGKVGVLLLCTVDNCAGRHVAFSGRAHHGSCLTSCRASLPPPLLTVYLWAWCCCPCGTNSAKTPRKMWRTGGTGGASAESSWQPMVREQIRGNHFCMTVGRRTRSSTLRSAEI